MKNKQKIITPKISNCYCGANAKIQTWDDYDVIYQVVCENRHTLSKFCITPHRAICKWNNRVKIKLSNNMSTLELLKKYKVSIEDFDNIDLVTMKMKAESVVLLFKAIENTLAPHISPVESEKIDDTRKHILDYLDKYFINI